MHKLWRCSGECLGSVGMAAQAQYADVGAACHIMRILGIWALSDALAWGVAGWGG